MFPDGPAVARHPAPPESFLDDRPITRASAGPRRQGGVFVFASTELRLEIDELVIEGQVSARSLERLRDGWIQRRLDEAGLGAR